MNSAGSRLEAAGGAVSPATGGRSTSRKPQRFRLRALGIEPAFRLLTTGLALLAGALVAWLRNPRGGAARARFRERAIDRSVATLGALKGPFAKAGQFAAHRYDVLPAPATEALASLRDRVPPLPLSRLRPMVEAELGAPLEALFEAFEPDPLGAASIGQVHRARLPGGGDVAVKIQYPWLRSSLRADLAILRALLALARPFGGPSRIAREQMLAEFETGLREELDFEREARVAGEIASNLADDAQIVVPRVVPGHSSARVLTVEYRPAVSIDDREGLARLGVAPAAVLQILARAYVKQMFVDGLFHADPHPGNLFVLDEPGARDRPRLLFVDFGLSRRLDPNLRREMRLGIHALLRRDLEAFLDGMDRMGMIEPGCRSGVAGAVSEMFERIGSGGALGVAGSQVLPLKDEAKALLQETPGLRLPNDLLLYAKTLSYVFALGKELDPDVDLLKLALPSVLRFLAAKD
jgi:predicted unusual protein kinase regulating ubiquinone biosynthesis (AarF/ABC1/UbiB family)